MNKKNTNLIFFSLTVAFVVSLPMLFGYRYLPQSHTPWQLQPFNNDSLSTFYKENYKIFGDSALAKHLKDTTKRIVNVLVDGWGVPYDENKLAKEFSFFDRNSTMFALHKRAHNYTTYAENLEFQKDFSAGIFLFTGDSTACSSKQQTIGLLFRQFKCCINCNDIQIGFILDSLLEGSSWKRIVWTTRETNEGDNDILHLVLQELSRISKKYSDVQFIIQGTHRPILGTPETRRKYLAPWVPAVFTNAEQK